MPLEQPRAGAAVAELLQAVVCGRLIEPSHHRADVAQLLRFPQQGGEHLLQRLVRVRLGAQERARPPQHEVPVGAVEPLHLGGATVHGHAPDAALAFPSASTISSPSGAGPSR